MAKNRHKKHNYYQGVYHPEHPEKYKGSLPIIYRSGLELKFDRWCDRNPNIIQWGSESVIIPYQSPIDGKVHKYFVDNCLKLKVKNEIKKFLVEIKPSRQTKAPKPNKRWKKQTIIYKILMNFSVYR
jgi:hypothetical protein